MLVCTRCDSPDDLRVYRNKQKLASGEIKVYEYIVCKPCLLAANSFSLDNKKKLVFDHYGRLCICCGESQELFLTIDHVNNDGSLERWPSGRRMTGKQLYSTIVSRDYPDTYQVLCMNCNWGKRMNEGVCPHILQSMV